jgi:Domain of unknown function (DUF6484)
MSQIGTLSASDLVAVCIGRIVEITADGRVLVDFPENRGRRPVESRFVALASSPLDDRSLAGTSVLIVFEDANPRLPIILGPVSERISAGAQAPGRRAIVKQSEPDGSSAILEAKEEVLLRCGESSLSMRKDGKIVLKGRTIVSRASRANKIRGASVAIN